MKGYVWVSSKASGHALHALRVSSPHKRKVLFIQGRRPLLLAHMPPPTPAATASWFGHEAPVPQFNSRRFLHCRSPPCSHPTPPTLPTHPHPCVCRGVIEETHGFYNKLRSGARENTEELSLV